MGTEDLNSKILLIESKYNQQRFNLIAKEIAIDILSCNLQICDDFAA